MPGGVASVIGSFGARLGMDETDYVRGVLNAAGASRVFGDTFATFLSNPLLGSIDLLKRAGATLMEWAGQTLATAKTVSQFAAEINASTEFVQALKAQYEGADKSFEASMPTLLKVVEALDQARRTGGPAADALRQLGVSLDGVTSTDEALRRIIDGLARVQDQGTRLALTMEILGQKSGPELLAVIGATNGAVDQMIQRGKDLGLVMDDSVVNSLVRLEGQIEASRQQIEGIKQTLISEFLAGLTGNQVDSLADNFAAMARTLREDLGPALRDAGELAKVLLELFVAMKPVMEATTGHMQNVAGAWQGAAGLLTGNGRSIGRSVSKLEAFGVDVGATLNRLVPGSGMAYDIWRGQGVGTP